MTAGMHAGLRHRLRRALRHMEAQHRHMGPVLRELQRAVEDGAREGIRELLTRFGEALQAHFELENTTVFPAVHGLAPSTESDLRKLARDHEGLLEQLHALHEGLAAGEGAAAVLAEFSRDLREHEAREEALLAIVIRSTTL